MGYGGALMWTAIARNLKEKYPDKAIIFIYKKSLRSFIKNKTSNDFIIYSENHDISYIYNKFVWFFKKRFFQTNDYIVIDMENSEYLYWINSSKDRIAFKNTGKHAIQIACDCFNISNPILKPQISLTETERRNAQFLIDKYNLNKKKYICIEPHSKKGFTPNKEWFWDNWKGLTKKLNTYIAESNLSCDIVQLGVANQSILDNVVDLTGQTTFREIAYILENSLFFMGYMGGLVHLAKSMGKQSIVLVSAFEPLNLTSYPDDINFYTDIECKNCGLRIPCPNDRECMRKIKVDDVFDAAKALLTKSIN